MLTTGVETEMTDISAFEKITGYHFSDSSLLTRAFTHSSYINEHRLQREDCNERLEFLGDAVLELVSSEYLYQNHPECHEGELTRMRAALVCEQALAADAKPIGISRFLKLGRGEEQGGGRYRDSVVSDAVEAVIGAIFLDGGLEPAKQFIHRFILSGDETTRLIDAKSRLQILSQEKRQETPVYRITGETGPDHNKTFYAEVLIGDQILGQGEGNTKKQAEQAAAWEALKII